jgi:hypothetical protein
MIDGYFGENGQLFFEIELVTDDGLNLKSSYRCPI